ncbi:MAG: hypothetical protein DCC59_03395 [Chloroflexi bacterium]|nr:hypothetical protein [Chloroflexi bacterium CFX1]MCK6566582.1 hypothetical protein [Anaerolineales bacterium]MDL1919581.1 hypothetical protein [Chloroflexi bacterium CFX5]NUQ59479.1 hypothetical protein [Anaerolineales bacterium]RIK54606.1 MAG: hypothetical protein DCC59_03395 [Chloroflexota bacterium]
MSNKRLLFAWALGIPVSYIAVGFLDAYYKTWIEIVPVSLVLHTIVSLFTYFILGRLAAGYRTRSVDMLISLALGFAILLFLAGLANMAGRFPRQFDVSAYVHAPETLTGFLVGIAAALPLSMWLERESRRRDFHQSRFYRFMDSNLGGIVLAGLFFSVYFLLASIFNQPVYDFDDVFFDADSALYRYRFGTEFYKDYYERTVHPYVLIIVRPLVWIVSLFLKGDMLYGAFIVTALTGALCVFLVWYFVKETTHNPLYASLIAGLFGVSTSQIAFGSLIENYIFLGAAALIFIVLLLKDKPLYTLVIAGLVSFGITISNIAQTVIAHFMVKRSVPQLIKYGLIVGVFIIPLNLLNNFIYPDAHPYLWEVSTLQFEEKNVFEPTLQRANYLGRVMLLHSFIAPDPLLIKEDIPFLKIWLSRAAQKQSLLEIARYETFLGNALVAVWLIFVATGGILFLKNIFKQDNRFPFAFVLTILFFFALHMRYGRDFFLYSANWTYAITLFLALAWREISTRRWFQISLLVFTVLLALNNSRLISIMLWSAYLHIR